MFSAVGVYLPFRFLYLLMENKRSDLQGKPLQQSRYLYRVYILSTQVTARRRAKVRVKLYLLFNNIGILLRIYPIVKCFINPEWNSSELPS